MKRLIKSLLIFGVLCTNIGCDQVSKNIAREKLTYHEQVSLISDKVVLVKVENSGAFLSLGQSLPEPLKTFILTVLPLAALCFFTGYLFMSTRLTTAVQAGIAFILGGGIGNIYDRIAYGSVTDFLHIDLHLVKTGIFNMADVSILTGAVIIVVASFQSDNGGLSG